MATHVEALKAAHRKHQTTQKAVKALVKAKVVTHWPEALQSQLGLTVDGLHMIDEKALSQLDHEVFLELRKAQALPIAYAVNLSIPQTHLLARLARLHPGSGATPDNLDATFGDDDEEFSFIAAQWL